MKFLKYLLYGLSALFFVFLAIGFIKPTVSYGNQIEVNKPIKESWAVYQDESKMAEWLDGFKSIEHISGEKKAVGSKYRVIVNPEGEDFEIIETILSMKEYDHMALEFDNEFMVSNMKAQFSEKDGKTIIKTEAVAEGKGMFMRSMMSMMGGTMNEQDLKNMTALKALIESNTTDYFPTPPIEEMPELGLLEK